MSRPRNFPIPSRRPARARLAVVASLVGAACLASPIGVAARSAPARHHHWAAKTAAQARETVENRISTLHAQLYITPAQETQWAVVAQVMRDNEAGMQKMIAEQGGATPRPVSAVEDLRTYARFTQAHAEGLKNLIASFETLYAAMPAPQQAVADRVFQQFGHRNHLMKS